MPGTALAVQRMAVHVAGPGKVSQLTAVLMAPVLKGCQQCSAFPWCAGRELLLLCEAWNDGRVFSGPVCL